MVTASTTPPPTKDKQQQQHQEQQQPQRAKFKLKNIFRKHKYAKLRNKREDCPASGGSNEDAGRSIEVLDLREEISEEGGCPEAPRPEQGADKWTDCSPNPSKRRVRFWRYSHDDLLLEDVGLEDDCVYPEPAPAPELEIETDKRKKKKSKKKRAKEVGVRTWKYCKTGWKYMKTGLVYYASGVSALNISNLSGAFRPAQRSRSFTDYTTYDKYDQYGYKHRQRSQTDYTKYDAYCKSGRH